MKPFNSAEMIGDYLGKGGYHFNAEAVLKDFDYKCFLPRNRAYGEHETLNSAIKLNSYSLYQINQIRDLTHRISTEYLSDFRHHIFYHDFYDIVYPTSKNWHYDIEDILDWKGYNAVLNCYFEDTSPENDDIAVTFTPYDDAIVDTQKQRDSDLIYVKKNDIVLINQTRRFLHRVTDDHQRRPILMFAISFMDFPADLPLPG
jgi:hypothetical protein